jgi:hypothetical protein
MHLLEPAARGHGRITRFLLPSLISAGLIISALCFIAPRAKATTTACQNGAATTVDGTIHKVMEVDGGFEFYIQDASLDCGRVYILSSVQQSCSLFSPIHATGTISQPVMGTDHVDWQLTNASFSCQQSPMQ